MEDQKAPQDIFLSNFIKLSQMLLEDNFTNMKNLNQNTHNFTECFTHLKGIIRYVLSRCQKLEERNQELEDELQKIDKNNRLVRQKTNFEKQLETERFRWSQFVPLPSTKVNSFATKIKGNIIENKSKEKPKVDAIDKVRKQFQIIEHFIQSHLSRYLVQDPQRKAQIPKNVLVTCYQKWSESRGHQILINKKMLIKMQITNVLKRMFPNIEHTDRHYKGIGFTKGIVDDVQIKREPLFQVLAKTERSQKQNQKGDLQGQSECKLENDDLRNLTFDQFDLQNDYDP